MHTVTYLICFIFFEKLRGLESDRKGARFWAVVYATVTFVTLLMGTNEKIFFGFSRNSLSNLDYETSIEPNFGAALIIAGILGVLFYYTVRMGGHIIGGRYAGFVLVIPGLLINVVAASLLISLFQ